MPSRPKKPYKTFPLWPHKSGSWCAVIDNRRHSFGGWSQDQKGDAALTRYHSFMETKRKGIAPLVTDHTVTVKEVVNRYLTRQFRRASSGDLGQRDYGDAMRSITVFAGLVGGGTRVSDLRPAHFTTVRDKLAEKMSASTVKRHITHIKGMFRWAFDQGLIIAPPRFGGEFKPPRKSAPRPVLLFTAEEINGMIAKATLPLRAMIRLGIECGFGNNDVATLRWEQVNLDKRLMDLHRAKTFIARRCAISADLVNDLKAWREIQETRKVPIKDPGLVFTTLNGERYVRETPRADPLKPPGIVDSVAVAFGKLLRDKLKWRIPGESDGRFFYTLRRTHRTWTDELRDPHASALVMGHSFGSVAGLYVQHVDNARLFLLNQHIVDRLKRTGTLPPARVRRGGKRVSEPRGSAAASRKPTKPVRKLARSSGGQFRRSRQPVGAR